MDNVVFALSHEALPEKCAKLVFFALAWVGLVSWAILKHFYTFPERRVAGNHRLYFFFSPAVKETINFRDEIEKTCCSPVSVEYLCLCLWIGLYVTPGSEVLSYDGSADELDAIS